MDKFEPRPYQKNVFNELYKDGKPPTSPLIMRHRGYAFGIDIGQPGGDKTVVAKSIRGRNGKVQMFFDEYADWPHYKWYQHPIQWWKWRRTLRQIMRQR